MYNTLLQSDRQVHHRRTAEMLEHLYQGRTEAVCEQLAHHWMQSDQPTRALSYLPTAAAGAVAMGANREAIGYLQAALDLVKAYPEAASTDQTTTIRLKLAGLHFIVSEH